MLTSAKYNGRRRPSHASSAAICAISIACLLLASIPSVALAANAGAPAGSKAAREKVIIDTDIGIDIDDAFAIALALRSSELEILGFSTASGDTETRARIIDRMLDETGFAGIPVLAGVPTRSPLQFWPETLMDLQARYGQRSRSGPASHPAAVDFMLEKIREFPGQVTLIAIGPLSNLGALIDRDIGAFRQLKRVVIMGGWLRTMRDGSGQVLAPKPEYNIIIDVRAAQRVFQSGVRIHVMPLDATRQLALDEVKRRSVFTAGAPLTDVLGVLYLMWGRTTPILYDAMAVGYAVDPALCPVEPMNVIVDDTGTTRVGRGEPNAHVCLRSDTTMFFDYYMRRLLDEPALTSE